MRGLERIAPIALALLFLAGCERTPEPPPPVPRTEAAVPPVTVSPPVEVPVPMPTPEIVAAPAKTLRAVKPAVAPLPKGFGRLGGGSVTDAEGQLRQMASFRLVLDLK